jgi:hypothetical protein
MVCRKHSVVSDRVIKIRNCIRSNNKSRLSRKVVPRKNQCCGTLAAPIASSGAKYSPLNITPLSSSNNYATYKRVNMKAVISPSLFNDISNDMSHELFITNNFNKSISFMNNQHSSSALLPSVDIEDNSVIQETNNIGAKSLFSVLPNLKFEDSNMILDLACCFKFYQIQNNISAQAFNRLLQMLNVSLPNVCYLPKSLYQLDTQITRRVCNFDALMRQRILCSNCLKNVSPPNGQVCKNCKLQKPIVHIIQFDFLHQLNVILQTQMNAILDYHLLLSQQQNTDVLSSSRIVIFCSQ